jgi:hypothetical protein
MMRSSWIIAVLVCCAGLASCQVGAACDHPLHESRAIVEYNPEANCVEVALCVFPDDLSQALTKSLHRPIDVEKDQPLDETLKAYVADKFQLRAGSAEVENLRWVGYELQTQQCWLYFEFPLDKSIDDFSIKNKVLMELFDDQINVAYARLGGRQRCLTFRTDTADWVSWKRTRAADSSAQKSAPASAVISDSK